MEHIFSDANAYQIHGFGFWSLLIELYRGNKASTNTFNVLRLDGSVSECECNRVRDCDERMPKHHNKFV